MPNPTDQNRLGDTTRGGVIVNLNAYRAEAAAAASLKTSQPLAFALRSCPICGAVTLFAVLAVLAYFFARR